jgi:hypothetical protein
LAPGSPLSIPLAYGDLDLSAQGTVTAVLPEGRILAFGHPMFGEGATAIPMATGFVHYIVPSITVSFKLGGSGVIKGTILRDEGAAIAGRIGPARFTTAPLTVTVHAPGVPPHTYHYQLVNHPGLTPVLGTLVVLESVTSDGGLPSDRMLPSNNSTMTIDACLGFAGRRTLRFQSVVPAATARSLVDALLPPLAVMSQNPYQDLALESMDVAVNVEDANRSAAILEARPDRAELAPGQTLAISVRLQPFGKEPRDQVLRLALPSNTPDGTYTVTVCDARAYANLLFQARPFLQNVTRIEDLAAMLGDVMAIPDDTLFAVLPLPNPGVAVGRVALPQLPSSRRALIASPVSPPTTPCTELIESRLALGLVPGGQTAFTITVNKDLNKR